MTENTTDPALEPADLVETDPPEDEDDEVGDDFDGEVADIDAVLPEPAEDDGEDDEADPEDDDEDDDEGPGLAHDDDPFGTGF